MSDSEKSDNKSSQCEGYRRYGGAFSLGPAKWLRCEGKPIVMLTIEGKDESLASCLKCWNECKANDLPITNAELLNEDK